MSEPIVVRSTRYGRPMTYRDGTFWTTPDGQKPTEFPTEQAALDAIEDAVAYEAGLNASSPWANPAAYTTQPSKRVLKRSGV